MRSLVVLRLVLDDIVTIRCVATDAVSMFKASAVLKLHEEFNGKAVITILGSAPLPGRRPRAKLLEAPRTFPTGTRRAARMH